MPSVTLLLKGLDGSPLGEAAYDTLLTAMDDYLLKLWVDYFSPNYRLLDLETEVTGDSATEGGNSISMDTALFFKDAMGEATARNSQILGAPSDLELELAAGYAWNDLKVFQNYLLVATAIDESTAFAGLTAVEAQETFATSTVEDVVEIDLPKPEKEPQVADEPTRGDVTLPTNDNLQIAAASSQLQNQSGTNALNPLWPSLIVGMAVFLITIIVLGYRKQQSSKRKADWEESTRSESVLVRVANDNAILEGDNAEIEVEDKYHKLEQEARLRALEMEDLKNQERNLDKEYATSCLTLGGAAALGGGAALADSMTSDPDDDGERPSKSCLKLGGKNKSSNTPTLTSNSQRGIALPRTVDLTNTAGFRQDFDVESWRNPTMAEEETCTDMSDREKAQFRAYMQSGMSVEEASSQIMQERAARQQSITLGNEQRKMLGKQSNPLDCLEQQQSSAAQSILHDTELMEDGETAVHIPKPKYMTLGAACSTKNPNLLKGILDEDNSNRARAMVLSEASSYASSYDDNEFSCALSGDHL